MRNRSAATPPDGTVVIFVVMGTRRFEAAFANMYVELGKQFSGGVILL